MAVDKTMKYVAKFFEFYNLYIAPFVIFGLWIYLMYLLITFRDLPIDQKPDRLFDVFCYYICLNGIAVSTKEDKQEDQLIKKASAMITQRAIQNNTQLQADVAAVMADFGSYNMLLNGSSD